MCMYTCRNNWVSVNANNMRQEEAKYQKASVGSPGCVRVFQKELKQFVLSNPSCRRKLGKGDFRRWRILERGCWVGRP